MPWSPAPEQPRSPRHRHWNRQDLGHYSTHAGKGSPRHSPQRQMSPGPALDAGPSQPVLACWTLERGARPRTGLLPQSIVFRQEQPPHKGSTPRGGPACQSTWEMGSKQKKQHACILRPRGSPCFLPRCHLRTGPPRPCQAALAAEHPPHPFRLAEVSYLIGNPWPTSEENVRTLC